MESAAKTAKAKAGAGAKAAKARRERTAPAADGDAYAAIETLLRKAIAPGGRVYEDAREALTAGAAGAKADMKPIKEALSLLQLIRELRADMTEGREIRVEFGDPRGLLWSE